MYLSIIQAKQIINLLLFNHFRAVMSYRRVQKEATNYRIRFGHSLWSAISCQRKWLRISCVSRSSWLWWEGKGRSSKWEKKEEWTNWYAREWRTYRYRVRSSTSTSIESCSMCRSSLLKSPSTSASFSAAILACKSFATTCSCATFSSVKSTRDSLRLSSPNWTPTYRPNTPSFHSFLSLH